MPAPLRPEGSPSRDWPALVRSRTRPGSPPLVPELALHLADDMEQTWAGLQGELDDAHLPPPFWAFAWLGGQALARYLLDHPHEVAGLRVLDLATGSGLCALAARRAGAGDVLAVDVDEVATVAAALNAGLNDLPLRVEQSDPLDGPLPQVDVVLAGDVFYDAVMSERVQPWLLAAHAAGVRVLVGDPGRHYLPRAVLRELAAYEIPTTRDLEGAELRTGRVYAVGV